jgi:hypothetical protein
MSFHLIHYITTETNKWTEDSVARGVQTPSYFAASRLITRFDPDTAIEEIELARGFELIIEC